MRTSSDPAPTLDDVSRRAARWVIGIGVYFTLLGLLAIAVLRTDVPLNLVFLALSVAFGAALIVLGDKQRRPDRRTAATFRGLHIAFWVLIGLWVLSTVLVLLVDVPRVNLPALVLSIVGAVQTKKGYEALRQLDLEADAARLGEVVADAFPPEPSVLPQPNA